MPPFWCGCDTQIWSSGRWNTCHYKTWQCPLLAPSVHGPQMVWECVCVCMRACVRNELEVCTTLAYPHISSFRTMPSTGTHPQTIWGQQTDGAKRGYCPKLNIILIYYVLVPDRDNFLFSLSSGSGLYSLPSKEKSRLSSSPSISVKQHCPSPFSLYTLCGVCFVSVCVCVLWVCVCVCVCVHAHMCVLHMVSYV